MKQKMRHYQEEAHAAVFDALLSDYRKILYTAATGTGKTSIVAEIVDTFLTTYGWKVLAIAHRREIVNQIYKRVRNHCALSEEIDIGKEEATEHARDCCKVIAGNVATVRNEKRLPAGWRPDVIIIDEAHRAAAKSYRTIMERFPDAIVIGTTATAKRTDKQALYAIKPDGSPVMVYDKKTKQSRIAEESETVFQIHCFEYDLAPAVEDGWLVPMLGDIVETDIDISGVGTARGTDGEVDLIQSQLLKVLEGDAKKIEKRVKMAYEGWLLKMTERPTIAFWPGVQTAKWAADYWRKQGVESEELNGESDNEDAGRRARVLEDFSSGRIQILHNVGLFTEGVDLPTCSGIITAAPTNSWNKYVQQVGRGGRPICGDALNDLETREERRAMIAASIKPDCYVLRVMDVGKGMSLCDLPAILDLPVKFDLEGHTVNEAKALMDEFEAVRAQVIAECPFTYEQLKIRLQQVELLRKTKARSMQDWRVSERGYTFTRVPPGYSAEIVSDGRQWQTVVTHKGIEIDRTLGPLVSIETRPESFKAYQDNAAFRASKTCEEHKAAHPQSLGTLARLQIAERTAKALGKRDARLYYLRRAKFSDTQIDNMPMKQVAAIVQQQREAYREKKMQAAQKAFSGVDA